MAEDKYFWLKVLQTPGAVFTYEDPELYRNVKNGIRESTSNKETFIAEFDDENLVIKVWRIGR